MTMFDSRKAMIVFAVAILSAAVTTNALAARHARHGGAHRAGRLRGGFSGPLTARPTPPVLNPWSPYTAPQAPETPVSPASPGSVFGN